MYWVKFALSATIKANMLAIAKYPQNIVFSLFGFFITAANVGIAAIKCAISVIATFIAGISPISHTAPLAISRSVDILSTKPNFKIVYLRAAIKINKLPRTCTADKTMTPPDASSLTRPIKALITNNSQMALRVKTGFIFAVKNSFYSRSIR